MLLTLLKWLSLVLKENDPTEKITNVEQLINGEKTLKALQLMHPSVWAGSDKSWDCII